MYENPHNFLRVTCPKCGLMDYKDNTSEFSCQKCGVIYKYNKQTAKGYWFSNQLIKIKEKNKTKEQLS